ARGMGAYVQPTQEMTVVVPAVDARSGPSEKFYPTSKLYLGDKVQVIKGREDNPGWVAIKPPRGSFSWINARFVKVLTPPYGTVVADVDHPEEVLVGRALDNRRPDKIQVRLPKGTQIIILDKALTDERGKWYPIQAPPEEVRYLPASAVGPADAKVAPQPKAETPMSESEKLAVDEAE